MRLNQIMKLERSFASVVRDIYRRALQQQWSSRKINRCYIEQVLGSDDYVRLPRYSKAYIRGVRDTCNALYQQNVVFSYEIHGQRLSIESEEYRAVSPKYVNDHCIESGAYMYRSAPNNLYYPYE